MVEWYIRPAIGRVPLAKLTPEHVAKMLANPAQTRLFSTSQRYVYAVLRIALGRAVRLGRLHRNLATQVDPPRKATPEMHALTGAEVATLLASLAGRRLEPLVITAVGTRLSSAPRASACRAGVRWGYGLESNDPRRRSGGHFRVQAMVGAERFERSTS